MAFTAQVADTTFTEANFRGQAYADEQTGFPAAMQKVVEHGAALFRAPLTGSLTVGTGSKSGTTFFRLPFYVGQNVRLESAAAPTNFMQGTITAYDPGTGAISFNISATGGSGTRSDFRIIPELGSSSVGITSLTEATSPAASDYFGMSVGGADRKVSVANLFNNVAVPKVMVTDSDFYLQRPGVANPTINFAANDYLQYARGTDVLSVYVGGTEYLRLNSQGNFLAGPGSVTPSAPLHAAQETTGTNNLAACLILDRLTTGTPEANMGGTATLRLENTSGTNAQAARLAWRWEDVTGGAEQASLSFAVMINGSLTEGLRLSGAGQAVRSLWGLGVGLPNLNTNPSRSLEAVHNDASTNTVAYPARLTRTATGTPGVGIGCGLEFVIETSNNNNEIGATIEAVATTVTAGAENVALDLKTMGAGAAAATALRLTGAGGAQFPRIGTTASAANAFLDNANDNQLLRSTSSARYKRDIRDVEAERARAIIAGLRPVRYRSRAPADRPDWSWYGLLAEEVAALDPRLVSWAPDEAGGMRPDGVAYDRLIVLALPLLQAIPGLEARLAALEARAGHA